MEAEMGEQMAAESRAGWLEAAMVVEVGTRAMAEDSEVVENAAQEEVATEAEKEAKTATEGDRGAALAQDQEETGVEMVAAAMAAAAREGVGAEPAQAHVAAAVATATEERPEVHAVAVEGVAKAVVGKEATMAERVAGEVAVPTGRVTAQLVVVVVVVCQVAPMEKGDVAAAASSAGWTEAAEPPNKSHAPCRRPDWCGCIRQRYLQCMQAMRTRPCCHPPCTPRHSDKCTVRPKFRHRRRRIPPCSPRREGTVVGAQVTAK
mmetsp:Transcript_30355/g.83109  ORF Transcript_30355/g.83109 Transcript_30355/m.83109 type:complete len:263 (-) Transcript_30355:1513-2301(-)